MRPEAGDAAYLRDMLQAARLVTEFVRGRSLEQYRADPLLRSAVERQIEIVGEAARRVSAEFRGANPHVPWRPIIAQRHILAHEYGEIDDPLVWRVALEHIPGLIPMLEALLPA
jgi:uncharacterized protein with HEPN domain